MARRKRKKKTEQQPGKYDKMPKRIPDSPENIAKAFLATPPKKETDWEYLKPSQ